MDYKIPKELILAYDDLYIGNGTNFPIGLFSRYSQSNCNRYCLELFRYAIETRLNWSPVQVRDFLTVDILKKLQLYTLLNLISFPGSLVPENNLFYIAWQIYPETKNRSLEDVELEIYQDFLDKKIPKMPKGYFTDEHGITRAFNCLIYAINKYKPFSYDNAFQEYEYFASLNCVNFLRKMYLVKIYNALELTPLEFFHYALPLDQRNDLYFNYFLFLCQQEQKNKKAKE